MKSKVCYDVIEKRDNEYVSQAFTIQDFFDVIKANFVSYETFSKECELLPEGVKKSFSNSYLTLYNSKDDQLKQYSRKLFENVGVRKGRAPIFERRVFNFNGNNLPMFDFYINGVSDFIIKPMGNGIIQHENKNIEKGTIIIRCYNYRKVYSKNLADYIDINSKLHNEIGLIDSQMRAIPWFLDEWINNYYLQLQDSKYTYVMSPLLHHCLKIYDKILLLSKQKYGYFKPALLKNAIDASFNDARILMGMNDRYKTINNMFLRVVPSIKIRDMHGTSEFSRFFNPYSTDEMNNAYSYSDVVSSGSGKDGKNKISTADYQSAINAMGLTNFIFTKEENTNNGLFAWINPEFIPIVNKIGLMTCNLESLNNHMIVNDFQQNQYITALNGKTDLLKILTEKQKLKLSKKFNQRNKLANSRTFLFDLDESIERNITKAIDNTDYFFHRNVNYLNKTKQLEINDYARNALVAFVDSDIYLPSIKEAVDMSIEELNEWMYSLRGVSCEGFFNRSFLQQLMLVPRTERLKCLLEDTDPAFRELVINFDKYVNKRFKNTYDDRKQFLIRQYMDCECTGKIINGQCRTCNNPRPTTGEFLNEYWVSFNKDFEYATIKGIKITEDGIDININYSIKLANSRFKCEELSKLVPVETAQIDIGYLRHFRAGDIDIENINVPLDGAYFGLGGFKSSINGIPFAVLRAYNALKGEVVYSSDDCLNNTELINEFLGKFKKSVIRTKMYNKQTKRYEVTDIEAWVGIVALSPTEVSQEFNKAKSEDDKNLSKANYALNNALDFHKLNKELSKANIEVVKKTDQYYKELVKIAYIYNSTSFMNPITEAQKAMGYQQGAMVQGVKNLTADFEKNDRFFNTDLFEKLNFKQYITFEKYQLIINSHPLFINPQFENGFYIYASLYDDKQLIHKYGNEALGKSLRALYFPKRTVLKNMFEIIGDNNVRMSDLLTAFLGVFETLSVSRLIASGRKLMDKSGTKQQTYNMVVDNVIKAVNSELFNRNGIVNQITNIAIDRMMSKQLTDIECPFDVTIQSNDRQYKEVVNRILRKRYPEKTDKDFEDGWKIARNADHNELPLVGWCWLEDVYCQATRQPLLFSKQNINIKEIWSKYKADIKYKNMYGRSFSQKHPDAKGIYLNSAFVAFNLEGDTDGDLIFLSTPTSPDAQTELAHLYKLTKNMSFFDKNNPNETAQLVRETYLVPSLEYLIDEASNLNFKLDKLEIGYSRIDFKDSFNANFDASLNKENVGLLTVSLWYITYFLDFYLHNFPVLKEKYKLPEITGKNKYEILFIFQYLLAQQNGVRAMKDSGYYGKITYDALVKDSKFTDDQPKARQLLRDLVNEYTVGLKEENIDLDFSESVDKLFMIFDNMFISNSPGRGFGFSIDNKGEVFHYKDSKWSDRDDQNRNYYDRTGIYDPMFLDFQASFILINGRTYKTFVNKFSYEDFLRTLSFKNKPHLTYPLLSYYYDIFTK